MTSPGENDLSPHTVDVNGLEQRDRDETVDLRPGRFTIAAGKVLKL